MRLFRPAVSKCSQEGHWKVSSSWPGRSGSIPTSNVTVPHSEQLGCTMESECGEAGANLTLIATSSFIFDRYGLRTFAGQAFKYSLVIVGFIGWLDARKKHRHSAHSAGWRKITELRRIIEVRLLHDGGFLTRFRRDHNFWSMMLRLEVRPTNESIREGCKYSSILESRKDRQRCKLSKRRYRTFPSNDKLYTGHVRFGSKADICGAIGHVCCTSKSGHS
jgi:hypothetical protein